MNINYVCPVPSTDLLIGWRWQVGIVLRLMDDPIILRWRFILWILIRLKNSSERSLARTLSIFMSKSFAIVGFGKIREGNRFTRLLPDWTNRKPPAHNFCLRCCTSIRNIRYHVGLIKHCCDEENRSAVALRSKHQQSKGLFLLAV